MLHCVPQLLRDLRLFLDGIWFFGSLNLLGVWHLPGPSSSLNCQAVMAISKWVQTTWMSCVSDEEQDRLDGFGLAVIGTWDGKPRPMEV